MVSLFLTLGALIAFIAIVERISWVLFRRKMQTLRFPSEEDPTGSYNYWLDRMRVATLLHAAILTAFTIFFCSVLW